MNNPLILIVLLALAWYSYDAGLEFFAAILVIAAVLMVFVQRQDSESGEMYVGAPGYGEHGGAPGQPIIIEPKHGKTWPETKGTSLYDTQHIRLQIKPRWKKTWQNKPYHYLFHHAGVSLSFIFRSFLYILGIEKDKPGE